MHHNKSRFSTFKTESQNSLLSNINDGGDDNETTESLKNPGGNIKNMGENLPGGNFLGGNFPGGEGWGGNSPGGSLIGWNFPGGIFWYQEIHEDGLWKVYKARSNESAIKTPLFNV